MSAWASWTMVAASSSHSRLDKPLILLLSDIIMHIHHEGDEHYEETQSDPKANHQACSVNRRGGSETFTRMQETFGLFCRKKVSLAPKNILELTR
jgi:hypothetical protein